MCIAFKSTENFSRFILHDASNYSINMNLISSLWNCSCFLWNLFVGAVALLFYSFIYIFLAYAKRSLMQTIHVHEGLDSHPSCLISHCSLCCRFYWWCLYFSFCLLHLSRIYLCTLLTTWYDSSCFQNMGDSQSNGPCLSLSWGKLYRDKPYNVLLSQ